MVRRVGSSLDTQTVEPGRRKHTLAHVKMAIPYAAAAAAGGSLLNYQAERDAAKERRLAYVRDARKANELRKYERKRDDSKIQRLVADARKAGIHPIAALGAGGGSSSSIAQPLRGDYLPQTGSALGDAVGHLGDVAQAANGSSDTLQTQLLRSQIAVNNASATQLLADAQSRSTIARAGLSAQSGSVSELGPFSVNWRDPIAAQRAQDAGGDIVEQVFGVDNMLKSKWTYRNESTFGQWAKWIGSMPGDVAQRYLYNLHRSSIR